MAKRSPEKLAIHGGEPVKTTPYGAGPKHGLDEWEAIRPIFERGTIDMTRGPEVMKLRERFKRMFGMKHAVSASSGTAALHAAMGALQVGRGDEVITSPVTDMGTCTAIMMQNAVPIFADVDPLTAMITPETVAAAITRRTRAVIVVHLAGLPADMRGIMRVCRPKRIAVVEDMAQSYMVKQGKRYSGTFGDIGCWSLNESKHVGAGDGGVMMTNKAALADRADLFADKCYDRAGKGRSPFFAAYNYRLSTLTAGVCLEQMKKVRGICAARHRLGARLDRALAKVNGIQPRPVRPGDYATYWYYVFSVDPDVLGCGRTEFLEALQAEGISAWPLHSNVLAWPVFKDHLPSPHACAETCPLYKGGVPDYDMASRPGLSRLMERAVQMPMSEHFTTDDMDDVARAISKVARHFREERS